MTPVLHADSIAKYYGNRTVLNAATLRAEAGAITLLIGRSGAGKTTLLEIAAGCVGANHGTVRFKGKLYDRPRWDVLAAAGLYYLAERDVLSPSFTVGQHLEIIIERFGGGTVAEVAAACSITPFLAKFPTDLSTGERRRLEFATAVARRPDCLLADEPFRDIDPIERDRVAAILRDLAAHGTAVVITGHEVADLLAVATHVVWCTDGTTYDLGSPEAARAHWRFQRDYLGGAAPALTAPAASPRPDRAV